MLINVSVYTRTIELSSEERNLATGAFTRQALVSEFMRVILFKPDYRFIRSLSVYDSSIKRMMTKYSEQLVFDPIKEIQFWLAYSVGAHIEPGYPPLYYSRTKGGSGPSANKSAIAAIGIDCSLHPA